MNPNANLRNKTFVLLMALLVLSCTKEFEFDKFSTDTLSGEWAFPLIKSSISIDDLLNDTTGAMTTGSDGLITLVYKTDNLVSMDGSERTNIPDQEKILNESFELPAPLFNIAGELPLSFDFVFELLHEDHRVDTMYFKTGAYTIGIKTNLNKNDALVNLVAENFIHLETGLPLEVTFNLSNPTDGEIFLTTDVDLTDYYVQFDNAMQHNTVYINGLVEFEADNNPNLSPYYFQLVNQFKEVEFRKFVGYVADTTEALSDTVSINLFNSTDFSNISFGPGSVRLGFDVYNSLGLPIRLQIARFTAYNSLRMQDSAQITIDPDIIDINCPSLDQFNEYVHTGVNTELVDINEVLGISPDQLIIDLMGQVNYNSPPETVNHFADNSNLYVNACVEIDLFAGISAFRIADTLDFDPGSFENVDNMEFMVDISNGFPINAKIQIEFVDTEFNVLCELIGSESDIIDAGIIGPEPDFRVISPTRKKSFATLNREQLDLIQQASKVMFSAVLSTNENQYVKIYSDYSMQLNLGAKVVYNY